MTSTRYFIDNLDMEINVVAKNKGDASIPGHSKIKMKLIKDQGVFILVMN